jgi:hypothetical protein
MNGKIIIKKLNWREFKETKIVDKIYGKYEKKTFIV